MSTIKLPAWAWGWVAAIVAALFAVLAWNGGQKALKGSQDEVKEVVAALAQSQAEKAAHEAESARLRHVADSLRQVRLKKDTVYVVKRDSALVWLDPITGISPDSASKLLPVIQNACRSALSACDEAKAAAAEEITGLEGQVTSERVRVGVLSVKVDSLNMRILELLTEPAPGPTFGDKVKKVVTVVVVILAIIGSFFVGQAAS